MRAAAVLAPLVLFAFSANAADRDFKDIVRAIADEYHTEPIHIPLLGLINTVTFVAHPAGTKQLNLAVFENLNTQGRGGARVAARIHEIVGASWKPFVEVRSTRKGQEETTLVYMQPEGHDCRLLVTTIERNEATVVQLRVNPAALRRWLDNPAGQASYSTLGTDHSEP